MATFDATVGGTAVDGILDVDFSGQGPDELGTAEIECKNSPTNRSFDYGEPVEVLRNGEVEFTGTLTGKPSGGTRNLKVVLKARDNREELHEQEVHRPFYDVDSGEVIRDAISKQTRPRDPVDLFTGSTLSGFDSDVPIFELADISEQDLEERGNDLLFLYWREGATGTYSVTFDDVPASAAEAANILWFETRYLFNNQGGFFRGEVELRDHSGNSYVWDLDVPGRAEAETERLPVEEADPDRGVLSSNGTLQYRIEIDGRLPEPRAAVIDYARTRPFELKERESGLDLSGVEDTGRRIVRRFDSSILELIQTLSVEDGATSYLDDDTLVYQPAGDSDAPVSITFDSTRVLDVDVDRDSADITNKVVAQGAGNLQKEYRSSSSIEFYGDYPREEPIVDNDIQRESELDEFAEGYLDSKAWEDTAAAFTVAGAEFRKVRVGEAIFVDWPPDDITGTFVVSNVDTDGAGRVTIGITGHGG